MQSYQDLLMDVYNNGQICGDRTGTGTFSVSGRLWRHNIRDGFPLLTTKKVTFRWVAEELFWFLSGSTNEHDLQAKGVNIWQEWATPEKCAKFDRLPGDLGPVYGELWRNFEGVDQISELVTNMKKNPDSRRLVVSGWHAKLKNEVELPPCHTIWQIKCWPNNRTDLIMWARSIDIFLGLPYNIASYGLLLHLLCHCTRRKPGELIITFGDLHLYKNHVNQARIQLERKPYELPVLEIDGPKSIFDLRYEHLKLRNYECHPPISAPVAI